MKNLKPKLKIKTKNPRCNARLKTGKGKCNAPAARGTTKCVKHGGMSLRGIDSPTFKTGKRSKFTKAQVFEKIKKYRNDDHVRDLREELSILRGILASYIESHEDVLTEERIRTINELIRNVERLVSSLKVIEEGHTFTIKNVNNVLIQVVRIIQNRVKDPLARNHIAEDLKGMAYISIN